MFMRHFFKPWDIAIHKNNLKFVVRKNVSHKFLCQFWARNVLNSFESYKFVPTCAAFWLRNIERGMLHLQWHQISTASGCPFERFANSFAHYLYSIDCCPTYEFLIFPFLIFSFFSHISLPADQCVMVEIFLSFFKRISLAKYCQQAGRFKHRDFHSKLWVSNKTEATGGKLRHFKISCDRVNTIKTEIKSITFALLLLSVYFASINGGPWPQGK